MIKQKMIFIYGYPQNEEKMWKNYRIITKIVKKEIKKKYFE